MRPWLFQIGPISCPTEAREELNAISTGLSRDEYVDKVWLTRIETMPPKKRPRSKTWPPTCRTERGFVLPKRRLNNVTPIRKPKP